MLHDSFPPSAPVAGIDVSKDTLDVFIDSVGRRLCVRNVDPEIEQLVVTLQDAGVRLVLLEATGRYHRRVAAALRDAGLRACVANPQRVREFARAAGRLEKSDAIDATVLADFGRRLDPRVDPIAPENQTVLRDLVSRRRALVQARVAEKNRAAESLPKLARNQSVKLLRLLDQQVEDLDRAIAKLIEADDDWSRKSQIIDSVPGIGTDSANQLVSELPELGTLNRQQIAKLAGVAPLAHDSGKHKGVRRIFGGRETVRCILWMLAHNTRLHCDRFRRYFQQLIANGKAHKVAMTACMRKLLVTLNQMVKTNTHWNPVQTTDAS